MGVKTPGIGVQSIEDKLFIGEDKTIQTFH